MIPTSVQDRQTLILLCAGLSQAEGGATPFGPVAWSKLNASLLASGRTAGELLGLASAEIAERADLTTDESVRIAALLGRGGPITIELERLADRGIWVNTILDETYPGRLRDRLGDGAPPLLFGAGEIAIANQGGIAIVGSRDAGEDGLEFATAVGASAARGGLVVISGAARGVDAAAMKGSLEAMGSVAGAVPDSLEARIRDPLVRSWLADGQLCLISQYGPRSGFSVGAAMSRNKVIYALGDAALVVSTADGTGGTWAGATEALKSGLAPVFVRAGSGVPAGNQRLIDRGAHAFPGTAPASLSREDLEELAVDARGQQTDSVSGDIVQQATLFGEPEAVMSNGGRRRRSAQSRKR